MRIINKIKTNLDSELVLKIIVILIYLVGIADMIFTVIYYKNNKADNYLLRINDLYYHKYWLITFAVLYIFYFLIRYITFLKNKKNEHKIPIVILLILAVIFFGCFLSVGFISEQYNPSNFVKNIFYILVFNNVEAYETIIYVYFFLAFGCFLASNILICTEEEDNKSILISALIVFLVFDFIVTILCEILTNFDSLVSLALSIIFIVAVMYWLFKQADHEGNKRSLIKGFIKLKKK